MCAWVAPVTAVTGAVAEAADFNNHRDDLNETAVAKSTAAGDMTYASAANALARLAIGASRQTIMVSSGLPTWQTLAIDGYFSGSGGGNYHIEAGIVTLTAGAGTVDFSPGFTGSPAITTTMKTGGRFWTYMSAASSSGFTVSVSNEASTGGAGTVSWIAFGAN